MLDHMFCNLHGLFHMVSQVKQHIICIHNFYPSRVTSHTFFNFHMNTCYSYVYKIIHHPLSRFFILGYYGTGFQMGIEVTYPISESITAAVMFLSGQVSGFLVTVVYSYFRKTYGDLPTNIGVMCMYLVCILITLIIPANLKRQQAETSLGKRELRELI